MFFIPVSNGLLSKEHRHQMGTAIWEFMWCIDKMTKIDNKGFGLILGGKPVNLKDFATQMGTSEVTTSRNLTRLAKAGYLVLIHTPYGITIKVAKAKKRFAKNDKPVKKWVRWIIKTVKAVIEWINTLVKPYYENDKPGFKNVKPNKTVKYDKTKDKKERAETYSPKIFFKEAKEITGKYLKLVQALSLKDYYSTRKIHRHLSEGFIPYWRQKSSDGKTEQWESKEFFDVIWNAEKWIQREHKHDKDWQCRYNMWHKQGEACHCKFNEERAELQEMKPVDPLLKKKIDNIKMDIAEKLTIKPP